MLLIALLVPLAAPGDGVLATQAGAAAAGELQVTATINGQQLESASADLPVRLESDGTARVDVQVQSTGESQELVRSVRVSGGVLGLTFFSYETQVDMLVPPGGQDERSYELDLVDLGTQATGLLAARLSLLDEGKEELGSVPFATDVDGSLQSVYGLVSLLMAAITAVLVAGFLLGRARRRLPAERWKRGAWGGVAGVAAGLTVTFVLSIAGVLLPETPQAAAMMLIGGAALFAGGFLWRPLAPAPAGPHVGTAPAPRRRLRFPLPRRKAPPLAAPLGQAALPKPAARRRLPFPLRRPKRPAPPTSPAHFGPPTQPEPPGLLGPPGAPAPAPAPPVPPGGPKLPTPATGLKKRGFALPPRLSRSRKRS